MAWASRSGIIREARGWERPSAEVFKKARISPSRVPVSAGSAAATATSVTNETTSCSLVGQRAVEGGFADAGSAGDCFHGEFSVADGGEFFEGRGLDGGRHLGLHYRCARGFAGAGGGFVGHGLHSINDDTVAFRRGVG